MPRIPMGPVCTSADCVTCDAESHASADAAAKAAAYRLIETQTFFALPEDQRAVIAAELVKRGERVPTLTAQGDLPEHARERAEPLTAEEMDEAWKVVGRFVEREAFERFSPLHQRMLRDFAMQASADDWVPVAPCFSPDSDLDLIMAFEEVISFGMSNLQTTNPLRFEQTGRWNGTALDPSGGGQGNPTVLTYSFPADGTFIASGVGEPAGNNDLNAFMDGIYGDRATWRAFYDEIFQRWADLSGNVYILEPNDDNVDLFNSPGVDGVRGDLRMGGKFIDGNSGTLAYNFFPQNGDMVIDTGDNFYFNLAGNSLRLRNILAHEHGHGMGQLHTCPITQSKLMEPFISLAFDGPQFDDILNAQRHYGDPLEPNDNGANATPLGALADGFSTTIDTVSLDDDNDADFYGFSVASNSEITVTLRPQGFLYQAGPQTGACNENQPYNPLLFLDPAVAIVAADGSTVVASADANGAGGNETLNVVLAAGDYFIRATGSSPSGDQIIAYELDIDAEVAGLAFVVTGALPTEFTAGVAESFQIGIAPGSESLVGTPIVSFRRSGEVSFTDIDLVNVGGDNWEANLPAFFCDEDPEYFLTAVGSSSGATTFPSGGSVDSNVVDGADVVVFDDDAQSDLGYTVTGDAGDGQWDRGVPQNNDRGDPPADFDGSGSAWLTDNNPADSNSDVDDGETILTGPAVDLLPDTIVEYAYWFNDIPGGPVQGGDALTVQVSTNGGATYQTVRTYTSASGSWRTDTLVEGVDYTGSAAGQGRLRFIASDIGAQNVIEAGIDAIVITDRTCVDPVTEACSPADITTTGNSSGIPDGILDLSDFSFYLSLWSQSDPAADVTATGVCNFGAGDSIVNLSDFSCYLSEWSAGCP
ncbi:MAG: GC-type dockerin domain-anchored protein [Planctomycetota bacterium]